MRLKMQKQIRMSPEGLFLLGACRQVTGFTDTKIMEICIAMHALRLGTEVRKAHEAIYSSLVQPGDAHKLATAILKKRAKSTPCN